MPDANPQTTRIPRALVHKSEDCLGAAELDIDTLGAIVQQLLQSDLAPANQRTYLSGKKKYLCFCHDTSTPHLPLTEFKLVNFVAYATSQVLKHQTIKCYLSAICHLQIEWGGEPKGREYATPSPSLVGNKMEAGWQSEVHPAVNYTSNTGTATEDLEPRLIQPRPHVGFFGFLRSGEMTMSEVGEFDLGQHLTIRDITVDNITNPRVISVWIK